MFGKAHMPHSDMRGPPPVGFGLEDREEPPDGGAVVGAGVLRATRLPLRRRRILPSLLQAKCVACSTCCRLASRMPPGAEEFADRGERTATFEEAARHACTSEKLLQRGKKEREDTKKKPVQEAPHRLCEEGRLHAALTSASLLGNLGVLVQGHQQRLREAEQGHHPRTVDRVRGTCVLPSLEIIPGSHRCLAGPTSDALGPKCGSRSRAPCARVRRVSARGVSALEGRSEAGQAGRVSSASPERERSPRGRLGPEDSAPATEAARREGTGSRRSPPKPSLPVQKSTREGCRNLVGEVGKYSCWIEGGNGLQAGSLSTCFADGRISGVTANPRRCRLLHAFQSEALSERKQLLIDLLYHLHSGASQRVQRKA